MSKSNPKREGYNARRWLSKAKTTNPYAPGSPEHGIWVEGYEQAARDSDQSQAEHDAHVEEFGEEEEEEEDEDE